MRDVIATHPDHRRIEALYAEHDREAQRRRDLMTRAIERHDQATREHSDAVLAAAETGDAAPPPPIWQPPTNTAELFAMRDQVAEHEARWIADHRAELLADLAAQEAEWSTRVADALAVLDVLADEGADLARQAQRIHMAPPSAWGGWPGPIDAPALCAMRATGSTPTGYRPPVVNNAL